MFHPGDVPRPRVVSEEEYEHVRKFSTRGRWGDMLNVDTVLWQAVKDGARPGDPIPPEPESPFVDGIFDVEVNVVERAGEEAVATFFSDHDFPGVRFAFLWSRPDRIANDWHAEEDVWFQEEMNTGALRRAMQDGEPRPDGNGVVWLRLHQDRLGLADDV